MCSASALRHHDRDDGSSGVQSGEISAEDRVAALNARFAGIDTPEMVRDLVAAHRGRLALVTSFGVESAVLLDLVSRADPATPVLFLDTGKHFTETLAYRDLAIRRFGLTNVRSVRPDPRSLARKDRDGTLWSRDSAACCAVRKVAPFQNAVDEFDLILTGRKRFHAGQRSAIPVFEPFDGRVRVNPLADWTPERIAAAFDDWGLPRHPLLEQGYRSVGCAPCTTPCGDDAPARAGRWAGSAKTECGIHLPSASA